MAMAYPLDARDPTAVPVALSGFLKSTDQNPSSEFGGTSVSDSCTVPTPETGSVIEPDQVPAGDPEDVVGVVGVGVEMVVVRRNSDSVGEVGKLREPPPQPARLTITATIGASRRVIWPPTSAPTILQAAPSTTFRRRFHDAASTSQSP